MTRVPLASSREVAEYLGKPSRTLDQWAYLGVGPKFAKIGRERRYKWSDVDAWVEAQSAKVAG